MKKLQALFVVFALSCLIFALSGCKWEVVFQSGFEEINSFTFPENWWDLSEWGE